ncbi:hypothetical protein [Peribacillus frigoritolerans]|uniref:hypothetical protein n=1 Tax=Peribacillus frigoritolerans TaxID=450367 RepID=UPI00207A2C68|nr:hypothetical protein [Peribacillus frigoritolerans]MEE3953478.1 hypothetical protein [Peribacillus frigoritolerans]USK63447.1 hypothetical protein LIT26_19750 [Peribacillus frigoritolerans]
MVKKIVVLYFLSICILAGCTDNSNGESSNNTEPSDNNKTSIINESEQNDSSSGNEKIKMTDLSGNADFIPLQNDNGKGEYKIQDLELDNAGVIIFSPLYLEKSKEVTIEFQLQSNDSVNGMTIGIIKDFSPDSNLMKYEIEQIYSESIDDKLKVTYTSPEDSSYSICIVGTMAAPVVVKNGKIILH